MIYLPRSLYRRLRIEMARRNLKNRSQIMTQAIETWLATKQPPRADSTKCEEAV